MKKSQKKSIKNFLIEKIDKWFWESYAKSYDNVVKHYKPYEVLKTEIINFIIKRIKNGNILDAGCGTGEISIELAKKNFNLSCFDISDSMLNIFKEKIKKENMKNIKIKKGDLNKKLKYDNNSFDVVINVHSLFMLKNKYFTLQEFIRVLKNKGYLIIAHHKPIKLREIILVSLKKEGILYTFFYSLKLLNAMFFNIILGQLHRRVYKDFPVEDIIKYLESKNLKLILRKVLYNGFDELLIFKR